jgi:hypothetical protein
MTVTAMSRVRTARRGWGHNFSLTATGARLLMQRESVQVEAEAAAQELNLWSAAKAA